MIEGERQPIGVHIARTLADRTVRFVFPSAVPALFWAQDAAERSGEPVDVSRFIAWDNFKAATLSADRGDAAAAGGAARTIFAAALLEENAAASDAGAPLLLELIYPAHARTYGPFIPGLARMLPALDGVVRRSSERSGLRDPYFSDLAFIRERYGVFLERYRLYEPSWNRTPFRPSADRWVLLFPELAEDWQDYVAELEERPEVRIINLDRIAAPTLPAGVPPEKVAAILGKMAGRLTRFTDAREELRRLALTVRALLDEGVLGTEDIVLSVPDLEEYAERLALEFSLLDIPISLRLGRSLAEYPGGRLFAALAACRSERWSFRSLKELLLDGAYPWKERNRITALVDFGLRYRCVSGYREGGREVDVWEETFKRQGYKELSDFYNKLKQNILAVLSARSFADIRQKLLEFTTKYLVREEFDKDVEAIYARSLKMLAQLSEIEERLAGLKVPSPYELFLAALREERYVFREDTPGVAVYQYRVAAGIGPAVHFLPGMTHEAATVRSDGAPFLREDRKGYLGLEEMDLSEPFIRAYALSGAAAFFSAPDRTFSAHSVPHRFLSGPPFPPPLQADELPQAADPLEHEHRAPRTESLRGAEPASTQRRGRKAAEIIRAADRAADLRTHPLEDAESARHLRSRLAERDGDRKLSPTDLNDFLACPFSWLLRRGLGIQEKQMEIETVDQRDLGKLYHRILERLFKRIAAEDARFRKENQKLYLNFLEEELDAALAEGAAREGAFQESVYGMLRTRLSASLGAYLETDSPLLDGCAILGAEHPLRRDYPEIGMALSGIADLVLRSNDGALALVDFKTGLMPAAADLVGDEKSAPANLQMASYIRMLEREGSERVEQARFYSLDNREYRHVVAAEGPKRSNALLPLPRQEYQGAVDAVDAVLRSCADHLQSGSYPVPPPAGRQVCASCAVTSVCRIVFSGAEA